ncbi:MAG: NUDIX hydrolase, partial [Rhabdochlamydiaceae bacterium]
MSTSVVCILILDEQALLIQRRDIPVWVLPGGGINPGETPESAACRETEEETGLKVEIARKIAEYTPINRLAHFTHFYEVRKISG